jgi:hypothetical protein
LTEQSLSHIPFRLRDELMIQSMARWMRFIGVVKLVTGLVAVFFVLVGLIFVGAEMGAGLSALGRAGKVIVENQFPFFVLAFFALILSVAGTVLGYVLYQAADNFEKVARTDVADQDYITAGLIQLKVYVKVSILLGFAAVLVALTAGVGLALKVAVVP